MRVRIGVTFAAAIVCSGAAMSGCSGSDSTSPSTNPPTTTAAPIPAGQAPVLLEQIRPAVAALEAQLGGPQRYFEINATPTLINLFVASADQTQAIAYVYQAKALQPPADAQPASGPTFTAAEMTFDETKVMALTVAQLPKSTFLRFAVTGVAGGGVHYTIATLSELGNEFDVLVGPTGNVVGTDQLTPGES
jgi:hypothetical protein